MIEIEVNKENLNLFLDNIRDSDRVELEYFLGKNYRTKFINTVMENKNNTYFLSYGLTPSCIGGIYPDKIGAQVWLLCAKKYKRKFLYAYIKNKLKIFIKNNLILYNYVFESNFSSLKLIDRLGFNITNTNDSRLKLFYRKGGKFDI